MQNDFGPVTGVQPSQQLNTDLQWLSGLKLFCIKELPRSRFLSTFLVGSGMGRISFAPLLMTYPELIHDFMSSVFNYDI